MMITKYELQKRLETLELRVDRLDVIIDGVEKNITQILDLIKDMLDDKERELWNKNNIQMPLTREESNREFWKSYFEKLTEVSCIKPNRTY